MKGVRQYILPLLTFLLIATGAAMPFAVSWVQDNRIRGLQEEFPLSTVNLKLQQEVGVSQVLRLISGSCNSIPWEEETKLTAQEAVEAAMAAVAELEAYGLLASGTIDRIRDKESWAEPILLIGEDGSSALVWNCYWSGDRRDLYLFLIDDATGKAVELVVSSPTPRDTEAAHALFANWNTFLQDYYGMEIISVKEDSQELDSEGVVFQFSLGADLQDGLALCELELRMLGGVTIFN